MSRRGSEDDVDDRYAGIDIDSLLSRSQASRMHKYGRKKSLYECEYLICRYVHCFAFSTPITFVFKIYYAYVRL